MEENVRQRQGGEAMCRMKWPAGTLPASETLERPRQPESLSRPPTGLSPPACPSFLPSAVLFSQFFPEGCCKITGKGVEE